ncbi:hypothetical protein [Phyllobacterium chamaecytisi]|uniref:hypothetical protein n=1 Tax=Phyllobacterium chamaecytisi TaxID=2876082 RepID=UPI001CCE66D2|nr:hypothetical protein [Phyllobacterium sp. KW56]MBZ9600683.1 hypothetical protein [Phyllobacterium sp. KW56]
MTRPATDAQITDWASQCDDDWDDCWGDSVVLSLIARIRSDATELTHLIQRVEKAEAESEKWKATSFQWANDEADATEERDAAFEWAESEWLARDPNTTFRDIDEFTKEFMAKAREKRTDIQSRLELAERQRDEALKALQPFVRDWENWVDENGWTHEAPLNDRICDWFGPSDFRAARAARGGGK